MAKKKQDPIGGSAAKKHPSDFTHMAVAFNNPSAIRRWVSSNFPRLERQA